MMEEKLWHEMTQSIKAVYDLAARVDERVKVIIEKQNQCEKKIDHLGQQHYETVSRLTLLESQSKNIFTTHIDHTDSTIESLNRQIYDLDNRLSVVEGLTKTQQNIGKIAFDFIYKTFWVVTVCYILYKLNLSDPPIP